MHRQGMYSSLAPVLWQNLQSKSIQRWEVGGSEDGLENVQFFDRVHTALPFQKQGFRKQGFRKQGFRKQGFGKQGSDKELFSKHFGNMRGIHCPGYTTYIPQTSCQNNVRWYIISPFLPLCVPLSGQGSQGHLMALRKCQLAGKRSTLYIFVSCTCVELHQEYPVTRIMEGPEQQCSQSRPKVWDHKIFRCYEAVFNDYHSQPSLQHCST